MIKKYYFLLISIAFFSADGLAQEFQLAEDISFTRNGEVLINAMAGGMNAPIFSQGDLDFDDVPEMIVFDRSGFTWQVFSRENEDWVYNDHLSGTLPTLFDWALLRDYNDDGIMDVFGGDTIGGVFGIHVYLGVRSNNQTSWELVTLNQGPVNVIYYEVAGQNNRLLEILPSDLPDIADVDFDGDLDILAFDANGGYVEFIENQQVERGLPKNALVFERTDVCWGKFFESGSADATISLSNTPSECFREGLRDETLETRHAGSTTTTLDYNRDGLSDILIGDIANDVVVFLRNNGTPDDAYMDFQTQQFPNNQNPLFISTFPAIHIVDADLDGLEDIIVTPSDPNSGENINVSEYYRTTSAENEWESRFVQNDFLINTCVDVSEVSKPALVDINGDGLKDLIIGVSGAFTPDGENNASLVYYRNSGTADNPAFTHVTDNYLDFRRINGFNLNPTPTFGDLDSDGDQDLLIGSSNGRMIFYENIAGAGRPLDFSNPVFDYADIDVGNAAAPAIFDLDGDGLADLIVGEEAGNRAAGESERCSHLNFFKNIGTVGNPSFNPEEEADINRGCLGNVLTNVLPSTRGNAAPVLLEGDDGIYLFAGNREGKVMLYDGLENGIDGSFNLVDAEWGGVDIGIRSAIALDDLDNDGFLELIVGNSTGGIKIFYTNRSLENLVNQEDLPDALEIVITPNPFSSELQISTNATVQKIDVFDSTGKYVESLSGAGNALPTTHWSAGLYIIKVYTDAGTSVQKVLKAAY